MALIGTFIALTLAVTECLSTQLCGKRLADMLDLVCDGRGFHWTQEDDRHLMNKRTAMQYLMTSSQSNNEDGGVVNECCHKSCSMEHLEKYCAAGPATYTLRPPIPRTSTPRPTDASPTSTVPSIVATAAPTRRTPFPFLRGAKFFFVRPVGPRPTRTPVFK